MAVPGARQHQALLALTRDVCFGGALSQSDIILGKRLGTGGFGTVFKGELKEEGGKKTPIIIKKVQSSMRRMMQVYATRMTCTGNRHALCHRWPCAPSL
jgi:hypothetical protein